MFLFCAGCLLWDGLREGGFTHSTQDPQLTQEGKTRTLARSSLTNITYFSITRQDLRHSMFSYYMMEKKMSELRQGSPDRWHKLCPEKLRRLSPSCSKAATEDAKNCLYPSPPVRELFQIDLNYPCHGPREEDQGCPRLAPDTSTRRRPDHHDSQVKGCL
ncbi:hypothetical protein E2C01_023952 [Portunus trituberculatus]|uniref:Uncharacterized protein n=1 Tax=Portunus trituberculatus TaxID=210409 RepID=A0A5B7EBF3_PORTR|nr:hypothetical protein [Portunus trituberculatus]